ncbi:FlgD immunoglobulin-like domain containing protein [Candidatus Syntrophosphaera thermopropionivorans]|uniref:T9SS type A sorting domain-containing protein n=1 Tax=Candidatus Syntrophosphaera thermopropionivorans TaxID=2593015 RepID=A0AC61QHN1_9BACT|nr:FlgD immunoglobulin-like domain containing protein [Candidatus Syntrophosphaera thermopropionivorans]TDF72454.1 T9SS type A sorting domain-containing protein [Candidatus Syntrophosphaera thermopropionivorans]
MKKYFWITLCLLLSLLTLNAQTEHFPTPYKIYTFNPYLPMNILVYGVEINGIPLGAGGELAAFDGDICVGSVALSEPLANQNSISINTCSAGGNYGDFPDYGAQTGHFILIKVWDGQNEYSYPELSVEFALRPTWPDNWPTTFYPQGTTHILMIKYDTPLAVSTKTLTPPPGQYGGSVFDITFDYTGVILEEAYIPRNGGGDMKVYAFDELSTDEYYAPGSPGGTVPNPDISPYGWFIDPGNIRFSPDTEFPMYISFQIPTLPTGYTLNESTLGIYYRKIHGAGPYTLVPGTYDAANGLITVSITDPNNIKGEYILTGFKQESPLPIELTSFFATISNQNKVILNWVSQTETDLIGYYVLRGSDKELSNARVISPLINATNTSQPKAYMYTDNELNMSGIYYYWLQYNNMDGTIGFNGPIEVKYEVNSGSSGDIPLVTSLDNVYPNPFNPIAYIPFTLETKSEVKFIIYNTRGQIVKTFDLGTQEKGHHRITWDGRDNDGNLSGNGIYYIVMKAGKESFQRKAVLMK